MFIDTHAHLNDPAIIKNLQDILSRAEESGVEKIFIPATNLVMVDHVNHLRREGRPRVEALVEGCGDRLRPVVMTAVTTIFGLLPLAFSAFTVAGAYIDSLAVGVLGGLATSTLFTLMALPVWYATVEDEGAFELRLLPQRLASATERIAPRRS